MLHAPHGPDSQPGTYQLDGVFYSRIEGDQAPVTQEAGQEGNPQGALAVGHLQFSSFSET
jgi:hypothetical protein